MTFEVDYQEYRRFCFWYGVKIKTVYDYDYGALVSLPARFLFEWVVYTTIGELM